MVCFAFFWCTLDCLPSTGRLCCDWYTKSFFCVPLVLLLGRVIVVCAVLAAMVAEDRVPLQLYKETKPAETAANTIP